MTNKKLKSKITTFVSMGTNPMDYSVSLSVKTCVDHCQLCGSALDYSFPLIHKDSTPEDQSKNLLVGSDCVENFMEAYFPIKKEEIKRKMKELVEKTKSSLFLERNPEIKSVAKGLIDYFQKDLRKWASDNNLVNEYYSLLRSDFYDNISKDCRSIVRKSYLSKPKTEKVYKLVELTKTSKFTDLLKENAEERSKKIKDVIENDSFYQDYLKKWNVDLSRFNERNALNKFEKQNFYNHNKIKKNFQIIEGIY